MIFRLHLSLPAVVIDSLAKPSVSSHQPALAKLSTGAVACIAFAADLLQIELTSRTVSCIQRLLQPSADIEARLRLLGEIFAGVFGFIQAGQICSPNLQWLPHSTKVKFADVPSWCNSNAG